MDEKTIKDFGDQWTRYQDNESYYGSQNMLDDFLHPLMSAKAFDGKTVVEVGGGSGRITSMIARAGATRIYCYEPSRAWEVLKANTAEFGDRVCPINKAGHEVEEHDADLAVSIAVIHHIPDPDPVMKALFNTIKPDGKCFIWIYGHEGNETYLKIFVPLRRLTHYLPDWILIPLSYFLCIPLNLYLWFCRFLPLPQAKYLKQVIGKLTFQQRILTIFDQLNPAYSKYYTFNEAKELMERAGFKDVRLFHRHGYSWSVLGHKAP